MKSLIKRFAKKGVFILFLMIIGFSIFSGAEEEGSKNKKAAMNMGGDNMIGDPMTITAGGVKISALKQQLIGVKVQTVKKRKLTKTIRTVGRVEYDERRLGEVNLKVEGWIEKLYADYTGRYVRKGEPLFKLYSPELLNAQEEYLLTTSGLTGSALRSSARTKLLLWDIAESQIERLEKTRKPATLLEILSPFSGYIISKSIVEGGHVRPGQPLLRIADIKKVWVLGDIYENEVPLVKLGQKVGVTSKSFPGEYFSGSITYIYPELNLKTRSVTIRIELDNPKEKFKPGMFTSIQIAIDIGSHVAVPESAILNSGVRAVAFLSQGNGIYNPREVKVGSLIDGYYQVKDGLKSGDVVVSSGNFFLDSESKLMSSSEGMMGLIGMGDWKMEHSKMGEMDMSGMDMSGMDMKGMDMKGMKMDGKNMSGMDMEGMKMDPGAGSKNAEAMKSMEKSNRKPMSGMAMGKTDGPGSVAAGSAVVPAKMAGKESAPMEGMKMGEGNDSKAKGSMEKKEEGNPSMENNQ